jgi:peptidoglycan/xylan/chitin deacetylase (PgdA/CDA1 family)
MDFRAPRRLLAAASCAAITIAACSSDRAPSGGVMVGESSRDTHDHGRTATVSQDLSATSFQGTSLPAKTLALTFDDGPGPPTTEISMNLTSQNIKAGFSMTAARLAATALSNPNGITVVADPAGTLAQLLADGHLVANHTTTHRDLTNQVPDGQRVQELSETDTDITGYVSPASHLLFRAPYGAYNGTVFNTLSASSMNKYVGPVYWEAGGFDTGYPNRAADWACWQGVMKDAGGALINAGNDPGYATTQQCGDAYVSEIENTFPKGIVLMHDPYSWSKAGASGSTVDMVKYIIPILVGKGYSFVRVDEVPTIAAALPCHATCATCSGSAANQCTSCSGSKYLTAGTCAPCSTCGANEFVSSACTTTANTVCTACNASCATCTGASATQCASCAANKFLSGGACTACAVCGSGKYQSAACTPTVDTVCGSCDASCTACSGPSASQCGTCLPAFFMSGGLCKACKVCAAGTFQATACTTTADATCTACPAGSFSKAGATSCTKCEAGTHSAAGAAACTACGSCDDANACTQDRCDPATGCAHDTIAGCPGTPSTSGSIGTDAGGEDTDAGADADAGDAPINEDGCSVSGRPGRGRDERNGSGLFVLAALGVSLFARRRRPRA